MKENFPGIFINPKMSAKLLETILCMSICHGPDPAGDRASPFGLVHFRHEAMFFNLFFVQQVLSLSLLLQHSNVAYYGLFVRRLPTFPSSSLAT